MMHVLKIKRTEQADTAVALPAYETSGSAGADLRANFPEEGRATGLTLPVGWRALVPTGLIFDIPQGFEVQIRPRSGLALKHGITVLNAPGTIDSDYRGEVGIILINQGDAAFRIAHGDRIAQMVFAPVIQCRIETVQDVSDSARGTGGFGSTGRN